MKTSIEYLRGRSRRLRGAGASVLCAGFALLCIPSCREVEDDVFERRFALTRIPSLGVEDHIELLDHKDPNIRYLALANLLQMGALAEPDEGGRGDRGARLELLAGKLQGLLEDPAAKVRAIAAFAPINRTGDGAEERLRKSLDDTHSAVRVEAVVSLGMGEWGARGELSPAGTERVAKLLEDENALVRIHALEALGAAASAQHADALAGRIGRSLARYEVPELLKALETLGRIDSDEAEGILLEKLDDDDGRVVKVAASGLTETRPQELEAWVLRSLAGDRHSDEFLIGTLAKIASERSRPAVMSMLGHPDEAVRSQAAAILEQIGNQASFDALVENLRDMVPAVEANLAVATTDSGEELMEFVTRLGGIAELGESLEVYTFDRAGLLQLLHSEEVHDQLVGMAHLAEEESYDAPILDAGGADVEMFDQLRAIAASPSPILRLLAYDLLGNSARPDAGEAIVGGLEDPVFQVRFQALEALVHHAATTGQRSPLRSVYDRRQQFEPTTFAGDDPGLLMRERLERAIREFEPSWVSVARAEAELSRGGAGTDALLASAYLAPRDEAMDLLLEALATGSDGVKTFALRALEGHVGTNHVGRLSEILSAESKPARKEALAEMIEQASD